jgi:hypothetical protein
MGSSEGGVGTPLRSGCISGGELEGMGKPIDPQGDAVGSLEGE